MTFTLTDNGGSTTTTVDYDFETKWGPIGSMMGGSIEKQLTKGFTGFLGDLDTAAQAVPPTSESGSAG